MQFIDTHCHLYVEEFDEDRLPTLQRALDAGVSTMLLPAIDSLTTTRQARLAEEFPGHFFQMIGLHPTSINEDYMPELRHVERLLLEDSSRYVAIGEIGLDFYWDTTYRQQQLEALRYQFQLAERYNLPVALHIRNAYEEIFQFLKSLSQSAFRGVFHCFSGTLEQARMAVEMGFHLGIGGVLTYKKSTLPDIVKVIPLERIVLETDCPYLAPVPYRGRRNESSYIVHTARALAAILGLPLETIAEATTANARRLFNLTEPL